MHGVGAAKSRLERCALSFNQPVEGSGGTLVHRSDSAHIEQETACPTRPEVQQHCLELVHFRSMEAPCEGDLDFTAILLNVRMQSHQAPPPLVEPPFWWR